MIRIFNINELTAPWFALRAALGQRPYVLAVDPLFPPSRRALDRLVEWAVRTGRARWIIELCPELDHVWEYPTRVLLYDIFAETEPWTNTYYGFEDAERKMPDYGMAYKQITCKYVHQKHFQYLLIESALRAERPAGVKVIGVPPDTVAGLEAYWDRCFAPQVTPGWTLRPLINPIIGLAVLSYSLGWILSRLRIRAVEPENYFFAADYMEDARDFGIYHEVADGGPILLVVRDPSRNVERHEELAPYAVCRPTDGRFNPMGALAAAGMVLRDTFRLMWHLRRCPPPLFYQVVALPWRRAVLRAFFTRFRPKYFWGRDDYNVQHILRREEIHRVDGISLGINHGYPAYACVFPMWRYISFDRYYVFGRALYERFTKDTWAGDMEVVPVGTFGASREDYVRRTQPKPKDIVIFSAVLVGDASMIEMIRGISAAFPDRKVLLQIKETFVETESGQKFLADCMRGLPNIVHTRATIFELFTQARYAFSDPSTVVVEALQFGLYSFCIDVSAAQRVSLLREFPGICVGSVSEAVESIRAIENGSHSYRRADYAELIDLSGRIIFDVIRQDIGLAPMIAPVSATGSG